MASVGAAVRLVVAYAASLLIGLIHFRGEALGAAGVALPPLHAVILVVEATLVTTIAARISERSLLTVTTAIVSGSFVPTHSRPLIPKTSRLVAESPEHSYLADERRIKRPILSAKPRQGEEQPASRAPLQI